MPTPPSHHDHGPAHAASPNDGGLRDPGVRYGGYTSK